MNKNYNVVAPLYIIYCFALLFFELFNNLLYVNLIEIKVPEKALDILGGNIMLGKFIHAISLALAGFWTAIKNLNTIRF
jgi:hypothetical protein